MHRWLIAALVLVAIDARADDEPAGPPPLATPPPLVVTPKTAGEQPTGPYDDVSDQSLGAELGVAMGGRVTAGGLRVAGHYLYQMSADDWFDGGIAFTFGGGGAQCFRDRLDAVVCEHGIADGGAIELSANVRRLLPPNGKFRPFARIGLGITYVRFSADNVQGLAIPIKAGGGVRTVVSHNIAVVAQGEVDVGFGTFNDHLGTEPQVGVVLTGGVEFRLR